MAHSAGEHGSISGIFTVRKYDLVILSLFHPKVVQGGAQQCAYDLFLNLCKFSNLRVCFIGATSPVTNLNHKPSAYLRRVSGLEDEYYFFTGEYDYFWHNCVDSRPIKDLTLFIRKMKPSSVFISHYMHIGIDLIPLLRLSMPEVHITVGLHEMLFACLADGQMVKKTNGELCHKAEPEQCAMCFPHIPGDLFVARKKYFKTSLEIADSFVVPAQHLSGVLQREMGLEARKIHVINHPIDLTKYPAPIPKKQERMTMRFGYFGQFVENKGIDLLLKAAAELDKSQPNRPFQIVINGGNKNFSSNEYQNKVEEMISQSKKWDHGEVIMKGGYTHDEIIHRMAQVDVVVVPSTWPEVYGLVVTEGLACYKPVIAASIGGLAERIKHGVDGFNFLPRDASDLAVKMRIIMEMSHEQYLEMAETAYKTAKELDPKSALESYYKALSLESSDK